MLAIICWYELANNTNNYFHIKIFIYSNLFKHELFNTKFLCSILANVLGSQRKLCVNDLHVHVKQ